MSFLSSALKNTHPSPPPKKNITSNLILNLASCQDQDQGQMMDSEVGLIEMSDYENSHFMQIFFQAQMESLMGSQDGPNTRSPLATMMDKDISTTTEVTTNSPFQVLDLSTSNDDHNLVMQGEKTPVTYGEVPDCVLARTKGDESPISPSATRRRFLLKSSKPGAQVCLEKRFSSISADTSRQQDVHSAVLSNLVTTFQESAEAQEAVTHLQKVMCHTVEPILHQQFINPESVSVHFHSESLVTKAVFPDGSNSGGGQELANPKKNAVAPDAYINLCSLFPQPNKDAKADMDRKSQKRGKKRGRPGMTVSQRKDRHNSIERERRTKIRLCCDELNKMVPFCDSDTDKVTTLQWTQSFLTYINTIHGDALKVDFIKHVTQDGGVKSSSSSNDLLLLEPDEMTRALEQ